MKFNHGVEMLTSLTIILYCIVSQCKGVLTSSKQCCAVRNCCTLIFMGGAQSWQINAVFKDWEDTRQGEDFRELFTSENIPVWVVSSVQTLCSELIVVFMSFSWVFKSQVKYSFGADSGDNVDTVCKVWRNAVTLSLCAVNYNFKTNIWVILAFIQRELG